MSAIVPSRSHAMRRLIDYRPFSSRDRRGWTSVSDVDSKESGGVGRGVEKEGADDRAQLRHRSRAVDLHAERGPAVESLRIPRTQRAQLVDHPALVAPRLARRGRFGAVATDGRDVTEAFGLVLALVQEQV